MARFALFSRRNLSYGYDWLNRLASASGAWGSYTYAYDQTGNRIRMVQGSATTVYCYGNFNRLSGYYTTGSCTSPTTSYTYDSNGNTATKTGGWFYSYDYENRMTKAIQSGTTIQANSYDSDGNRVQQTAGSNTFTYSYQGLNILYEKNITGTTTTITKHFYAGRLQVAKMVGTGVYYLHQDALGSTRLETTSTVSVKFSSNYAPYGPNYAVSGKETFMYTGKPYDPATGLYYYGARYYDPSTGRFVTQDSYAGDHNDPMSMNRYVYARDNPERYTDPTGHTFAGRSFTDYDDPNFISTLVAATAPGGQTVYLAPTTTSTTSSGGTTTTMSVTTFVGPGGSTVSYAATSKTTTNCILDQCPTNTFSIKTVTETGPTVGMTNHQSPSGFLGALGVIGAGLVSGVAVFWGGLKVASSVAATAGIEGVLPATIEFAGPLVAAVPFLFGTGFAIGYVIGTMQSGQTPTWQGAWNAFQQGFNTLLPPI